MAPIDWRDLYASNQEVIRRARNAPGAASSPPERARTVLPPPPLRPRSPSSRTPAPGRELTFTIAARTRRARVHLPDGVPRGTAVPLLCMLHGCTQDAAGFAAATCMDDIADDHGFAVVYPQQERGDNPQGCWNWFLPEHQRRGSGEPASIAGLVGELMADGSECTIDPRRVFVAGLSAGGAMAAIVAATYPDVFAALAVHSGLPYASAHNMLAALQAMSRGAGADHRRGHAVSEAMDRHVRPVPTIVIHGSADPTVAPVNAERVLEQWMSANHLAAPGVCDHRLAHPAADSTELATGGHRFRRRRWTDAHGMLMHELLIVEAMGHAWSGGPPGGSYTDPRGPDASQAIWRFFADAGPPAARQPTH